jgi:hypothetical protein
VRGARLYEHLDETAVPPSKVIQVQQADKTMKSEENPAYAAWFVQDQQLLSFLLNFVTKEVLGQVTTEASAAGAWRAISGMFASQSQARIVHLCSKLSSTHKGDQSYAAYFLKMKGFADEMAVVRKRLDDDVIYYILAGLDFDFNSFVEGLFLQR